MSYSGQTSRGAAGVQAGLSVGVKFELLTRKNEWILNVNLSFEHLAEPREEPFSVVSEINPGSVLESVKKVKATI